jgi:hypothetical protein
MFAACECGTSMLGPIDGGPPPTPDAGPPSGPKRVFVTSLTYLPTAVQSICQNVADSRGLGGQWVAWLSERWTTGDDDAIDKITSDGPWLLLTGQEAFHNRGQLATTPSVPINVTEMETTLGSGNVWTGTILGGTAAGWTCENWDTNNYDMYGTTGSVASTEGWTASSTTTACNAPEHVYCFER